MQTITTGDNLSGGANPRSLFADNIELTRINGCK